MNRRNMIWSAFSAIGATLAAARAHAATETPAAGKLKVVYHLADLDKVAFVLGNIRNHISGLGGPGKVRIALVVHGPALKAFRSATPNVQVKSDLGSIRADGVELHACRNTMDAQKISLDDLLPGFVVAEQGAVVKVAELQAQGWAYLRP